MNDEQNKSYKLGIMSACIGYTLIFLLLIDLPEIMNLLTFLIIFGLLGFAYKSILIRNDLPAFFVGFGGFAVIFFWGSMLIQFFELVFYIMDMFFS